MAVPSLMLQAGRCLFLSDGQVVNQNYIRLLRSKNAIRCSIHTVEKKSMGWSILQDRDKISPQTSDIVTLNPEMFPNQQHLINTLAINPADRDITPQLVLEVAVHNDTMP
jgi:hypothetical protein